MEEEILKKQKKVNTIPQNYKDINSLIALALKQKIMTAETPAIFENVFDLYRNICSFCQSFYEENRKYTQDSIAIFVKDSDETALFKVKLDSVSDLLQFMIDDGKIKEDDANILDFQNQFIRFADTIKIFLYDLRKLLCMFKFLIIIWF